MRMRIALFGGSLLELEWETGKPKVDSAPFGFGGGSRCESVDLTSDRDPLAERGRQATDDRS